MTNEDRYKEALERISNSPLNAVQGTLSYYDMAFNAKQIATEALNPQPQFEEVDVIKWLILHEGSNLGWPKGAEYDVKQDWVPEGYYQVKVIGTFQRPISQKVKRREEVRLYEGKGGRDIVASPTNSNLSIPMDAKLFAEWEE